MSNCYILASPQALLKDSCPKHTRIYTFLGTYITTLIINIIPLYETTMQMKFAEQNKQGTSN